VKVAIRPSDLGDVPAILGVVQASDVAATGEPEWTVEEVVATLTAPHHDPERDSWLAELPSGAAVGWAYLDNPARSTVDNVEVYAHPEYHVLYRTLLDRALARAAERGALIVRAGTIVTETDYIRSLTDAGFSFVRRHARMRIRLDRPRPPVSAPIRPVRPDDEAELRRFHEVLAVGFAHTPGHIPEYETWRAGLGEPTWDEWFVATGEDGAIVGALQSSDQSAGNDEGWIKNVAVLPGHRGLGLGRALLLAALRRYTEKHRKWAGLGVDLSNPTGAYRLYTSIGMRPAYEADVYERAVTPRP
jgi:ribosomal protein S18 acetylase RimI-like enzyme